MSSCHTRIACHGEAASPVVGPAVYAFIPEVSFSCPLILLRWQIWLTCKASSLKKKRNRKKGPGSPVRLDWLWPMWHLLAQADETSISLAGLGLMSPVVQIAGKPAPVPIAAQSCRH